MKSIRARPTLVIFCCVVLTACASQWSFGGPQYGVCRKQIAEYLDANFQQRPIEIDMTYAERRPAPITTPPSTGQAVVYVAECDGYHVFDVYGTAYDCENRAHYGAPTIFVQYRVTSGGCRS